MKLKSLVPALAACALLFSCASASATILFQDSLQQDLKQWKSTTKAAIVGFTRSLALALADKGIRVNGVAPGPIWTPLIPSTFEAEEVATFGSDVPMRRAGQPEEVAPSFVFLASSDSSYMTGQMLHPNGGEVVNA